MATVENLRERVAISELQPHPKNYRKHPEDQLLHIAQSLREHGQYRNVVVAQDGTILAGHGVVEAATSIGWEEIEVVRLPISPDHPSAIKVLTGDNEMGRLAEVDDRQLAEHLKGLAELDELLGTGFDDQMLASLVYVTRMESEIASMNEAAHWVGMPDFEAAGSDLLLVLHFESEEEREKLIEEMGVTISKKTRQTWSGNWPPREKSDLSSLRFDG